MTPAADPTSEAEPWRACYRQLAPKLLLFARQWLSDHAAAEDAVQNAFVRFWRKHPAAPPSDYPLLYAAVRSAALDALRSEGRRARRESASPLAFALEDYHFDAPPGAQDEAQHLQEALSRLPERQREVIVLKVWGELTFAEIARALGESINTVASRYRYGIEALRHDLHAQHAASSQP